MKSLMIVSGSEVSTQDQRLLELSRLMGVNAETLRFAPGEESIHDLLSRVGRGAWSLALHTTTLRRFLPDPNSEVALEQLLGRFQEILVYGQASQDEINDELQAITDGAVRWAKPRLLNTVRYSLPKEAGDFCAQLAGQSLSIPGMHSVPALEIRRGCESVDTIMTANEQPVFVRFGTEARRIFLLAGDIPDINKPLEREAGLGDDCISLLPPLIFLRQSFSQSCWHGGEPAARLIIDDPLLNKKYGALNYEDLIASMKRFGYGASIAFIPWNHWRTSRSSARRLLSEGTNLSICVHGCDHTNHEFQMGSPDELAQKAALGMKRMGEHRKRVGAAFEEVMVFPQGQFSKAAIPALRTTNYLAAVNSTCFPTDSGPNDLKIADFLWPAVTRFDGFPVFQRRYPRSIFEFALDLFLGKPALIVEHHEYFRDSCEAMEKFVMELKHIEPGLAWPGLSELLMRCSMKRRIDDDSYETLFFTRQFRFMPKETEEGRCRLSKFEPDHDIVERVLVDGRSVDFGFEQEHLIFEVFPSREKIGKIEIVDRPAAAAPIHSFGIKRNASVLVRRGLSEFRDSTLSRHEGLLKLAKRAAKVLKATGEA